MDQNTRNVAILSDFLRDAGYRTNSVSTLAEFDEFASDQTALDDVSLAMVDLQGFDARIWERCRKLHDAAVAFIVIARPRTAEAQHQVRRQSHGAGARHTLTKPLRKEQLLTLVRILTETDEER